MRAPSCSDHVDEILGRGVIEDPHPFFARLRKESPLSRVEGTGVHFVSNWALIEEVLEREEDFSANLTGVLIRGEDGEASVFEFPSLGASDVIATADEPSHSVHRRLLQPRLTPGRIARLEGTMRSWVDEALAPWLASGGGDFVPVCEGVPARALADLLGLPQEDVGLFRKWAMMGGDMLAGDASASRLMSLAEATAEMAAYLGEHFDGFAAARHSLGEAGGATNPDPDTPLLALLADGVRSSVIERGQAIGIAIVLFGAGGESTAALLATAMRWLAEDPALADRLRETPESIGRFVEEIVRLDPPFKFHYRSVKRSARLAGFDLEKGDRLMLVWASANRDPAVFDDPDSLRLDRRHPKKHMGFGRGAHFCIGAPLARLEATVLLGSVLERTHRFGLRPGVRPRYAPSIFIRRLERLDLEIIA
jgi:cytochrome P450